MKCMENSKKNMHFLKRLTMSLTSATSTVKSVRESLTCSCNVSIGPEPSFLRSCLWLGLCRYSLLYILSMSSFFSDNSDNASRNISRKSLTMKTAGSSRKNAHKHKHQEQCNNQFSPFLIPALLLMSYPSENQIRILRSDV